MGEYKGRRNPAKRREYNRNYTREYKRRRREEYLGGAVCLWCGSTDDIELHHVDPETKIDHRIWTWSRDRLEAELAKCITLCQKCHQDYHYRHNKPSQAEEVQISTRIEEKLDSILPV